ncbi:MAG: geranylgeranyl reductase family protein [Candidatus Aenigmatarchaeota archaeon]
MLDLIVVGGGPIGCYLAKEFSDKGLEVLVLEEHKNIGEPLGCSGHVSNLIWNFIPKKDDIIENEIKGAKVHLRDESYKFEKENIHSYVVSRIKLDKYMAKMAKEAGVDILYSHEVKEVFDTDSHVTIYAKNENHMKNFKSKMVAGCDGVYSQVRKSVGGSPKKILKGLFCYIDRTDSEDYVELYPNRTRDFFAWKIPRGSKVEYGLASEYTKENYKNLMELLGDDGVNKKDIIGFHSGGIPIGLAKKIASGRIFLLGDAAGTVKPFTGGGIIYGLVSAKIASKHIKINEPKSLRKYEKDVKEFLKYNIRCGKIISEFYKLPGSLQKLILDISNNKIIDFHMDKPSEILPFL